MAVIIFTSNASTGAGSLVEAIKNAQPGDVVRPDETVFERGATIEIALASTLTIDKNLTLDGGPFRVVLNGGGSVACAAVANGATASFTSFDFIGGATSQNGGGLNVETGANVVLNRCRVCGCDAAQNGGGVCVDDGATLELNDGVITGCRANVGGGVYLGATARFTANGSTLALNVDAASNNGSGGFSDVVAAPGFDTTSQTPLNAIVCNATSGGSTLYDATTAAENGSVVGVSSAEIGFVAAGGVSAPYASWSRDAWRDRDLRLLDDASPNPSPYRDAGSVDNMSRYDVQGAFRGRETDGVATCSPGAYETIRADLFWVGEPFPQEMVDAAPQNVRIANYRQTTGSDVYFEADMTWEIPDGAVYSKIVAQYKLPSSGDFVAAGTLSGDATGRKSTQMREGSRYIVRVRGVFKNGDYTAWAYIDFVARAALDDADGGGQTSGIMLPSPLSVVNPSFLKPDGWATSRFATASSDAAPQIGQTVFVDGNVRFVDVLSTTSAQTFGLTVGGGAVVAVDAASRVYFDKLQIALGASFTSTATAQARMSTRCGAWSRINSQFDAATPCDFDAKSYLAYAVFYTAYIPNAATYGALKVATASNDMIRLSGEYVCDVFSTAQNGTATDQTIRVGDGSATIRARQFRFGGDGASNYVESFFDRPVTLKLQGAASVSLPSTRRESWADDFLIDVTESTSAMLSLCGQTVYGDAPTAAVSLTGNAKIDGANSLTVFALTFEEGATVEFANDASVILTTALATSATATGPGAFFAPTAAPEGLTLENGAVWGDASAGVTSLDVDPTSATTATFTVVKTNADANIVAQYSDDDGATWRTVATTADVDEYELTVAQGADVTVRVATATGWLVDTVSTAPLLPVWTCSNAFEHVTGVVNAFEVATGGSNDGLNVYDFNDYGYL